MDLKNKALFQEVLTPEALHFVACLQKKFNPERKNLLKLREDRQMRFNQGDTPSFLKDTESMRNKNWRVVPTPKDLEKRHVEITGPVEAKMIINALNSGADVFMADFEDSLSPTWENIIQGQKNLKDAVRHNLQFTTPNGKEYKLNEKVATLLVRPRGWHLVEKNLTVDSEPISASLFDFGLYFFHNAQERLKRGTAPYFYLPKLESHLEARLWNDVFNFAQDELKIPQGTIRATVLIETIPAAFEMEEILYELRDHSAGLNAGRWDYIFSIIKKFRAGKVGLEKVPVSLRHKQALFPDRSQITMAVPFMRAYTELLVKTCHKRGAHAIGGMSAFVPSRKDPQINEVAFTKVCEDKEREVSIGFDGTWVAHPDLVEVAKSVFEKTLGDKPHQKEKLRKDVNVKASDLLNFQVPEGKITEKGVMNNISVALQYLNHWLQGTGAATIYNLMEDAATAEISRAQLWQWIHNKAELEDGRVVNEELYKRLRGVEIDRLGGMDSQKFQHAVELLDGLVLSQNFSEFLTIPAYAYLD